MGGTRCTRSGKKKHGFPQINRSGNMGYQRKRAFQDKLPHISSTPNVKVFYASAESAEEANRK
jgi:hypothetical protein